MKKDNKNNIYKRFFKRFIDIAISLTAILVLSPILLLLYIFNVLFVGFPTIFKQPRPGKNNEIFYIYKFRSMNNKKDKEGNLLPDSQRITLWGKIMRKTSLDELPQLFCILFGKMSIIGPRPRLVKDILFYEKEVYDSYTATPGLTGPTQSSGRNENTWEQVFIKDKHYTENISFKEDVKIFFKTFISVFKDRGASRDNAEEDVKQVQEYYYADYLLRTEKITKEQYRYGIKLANSIAKKQKSMRFHPELLNIEKFNEMNSNKKAILLIKNNHNQYLDKSNKNAYELSFVSCPLVDKNHESQIKEFLSKTFMTNKCNISCKLVYDDSFEEIISENQTKMCYGYFY